MSRYATFYRAQAAVHKAQSEAFKIDPTYDHDEFARSEIVAAYAKFSDDYERMANEEDAV